eukprot:scaffold5827_cov97-Cylindrotheca_fusiformis.AAC.4
MKFLNFSAIVVALSFHNIGSVDAFAIRPPFRASRPNESLQLGSVPRRKVLGGVLGGATALAGRNNSQQAGAATTKSNDLLADLPMVRLKLPKGGLGREYVALKLKIDGKGPYEFMVDSGLTTELITPHLQSVLGIDKGRNTINGLAAGGGSQQSIIALKGASLCCGDFSNGKDLDLPNLYAVITDFPQEHIDPAHDPIEGMLGMEMLSRFDCDLDFPNNRIRFWKPGTADKRGLVEIPAVVINETGLIGVRITVPGAPQPILGFLDCGASFSCLNWKAATALGLPPKNDPSYRNSPAVSAIGVDGRPLLLPAVKKQLTFTGDAIIDPKTRAPSGFESPPPQWKPWNDVMLTVGDIPAFSTILGDGRTPYQGPAALIGLDVLAQRRVILEAGKGNSRQRRVYVAPKS